MSDIYHLQRFFLPQLEPELSPQSRLPTGHVLRRSDGSFVLASTARMRGFEG